MLSLSSRTRQPVWTAFAVILTLSVFAGCGSKEDKSTLPALASQSTRVLTVNYPLAYFGQRIAGSHLQVDYPGPPDEDPAFWEPDDAAIAAFQEAGLILLNGADYAKWRAHVSLPENRCVNTSEAFAKSYISAPGASHSHGKDGEHDHGGVAFTTWIDFALAKEQARAILDAFIEHDPAHEADFRAHFELLAQDLDALDAAMQTSGKRIGTRPILASHPVYQYLTQRYGLNIKALLWEPETVPDAAAMTALAQLRGTHLADWMIWEGAPAEASVAKLNEIGIASLVFSPCGNKPATGDWLSVMKENLTQLDQLPDQ